MCVTSSHTTDSENSMGASGSCPLTNLRPSEVTAVALDAAGHFGLPFITASSWAFAPPSCVGLLGLLIIDLGEGIACPSPSSSESLNSMSTGRALSRFPGRAPRGLRVALWGERSVSSSVGGVSLKLLAVTCWMMGLRAELFDRLRRSTGGVDATLEAPVEARRGAADGGGATATC